MSTEVIGDPPVGGLDRRFKAPPMTAATVVYGVLAVVVIGGMLLTPSFLTSGNIRSILQAAALTGIVGVAMTPMAMSGNFVSLASQQTTVLGAISFVYLVGTGMSPALAIVITLAGVGFVGAVQGVIVAMGLNPVITTLAFGVITLGTIDRINTSQAAVTVNGHEIGWGDARVAGMPIQVVVFAVVTLLVWALMSRTANGRRIMLVGANDATARLTGISATVVTIAVFILASLGMAIAGILGGAQFGVAGTSDFSTITIDAVAAILIGGTSIGGGLGSPLRTAIGAVVIAAIQALMVLNGFSEGERQVISGAIVVGVVAFGEVVRRRKGAI